MFFGQLVQRYSGGIFVGVDLFVFLMTAINSVLEVLFVDFSRSGFRTLAIILVFVVAIFMAIGILITNGVI